MKNIGAQMAPIKQMNKIMVIQWTDESIRVDLGLQKIEMNEIINVLINAAKGYKEEYGTN
jgi:hypothetical protein